MARILSKIVNRVRSVFGSKNGLPAEAGPAAQGLPGDENNQHLSHVRQFRNTVIGILAVLLIGTAGYMTLEDWSFMDAFYMTVITLTTIGFGETHPLSTSGRIFTLMIIFCGMGMMGYAVLAGTRFVLEGEINRLITRRRSMKAMQQMRDHFIVCGFGRIGSFICEQLDDLDVEFVVIESDLDKYDKLGQIGYLFCPGDATEESVLESAGVSNARGMVIALDTDAANLSVAVSARDMNADLRIVARAVSPSSRKRLLRVGADHVISQFEICGMGMIMGLLHPHVSSFLETAMDLRQSTTDFGQVQVSSDSSYVGKRLMDTDIRRGLNLIITSIIKKGGKIIFNPGPFTVIEEADILIAMGKRERLNDLERKTGGQSFFGWRETGKV